MSTHPQALDHMLAAWNEADPSLVRSHLEQALTPDVRFVDPSVDVAGIDGFEANVHEVQTKNPYYVYSRSSAVDSHHGFYRYHWAIHDKNGKLVLPGFDVVQTDEDGQISCVIGFFGELRNASNQVEPRD